MTFEKYINEFHVYIMLYKKTMKHYRILLFVETGENCFVTVEFDYRLSICVLYGPYQNIRSLIIIPESKLFQYREESCTEQ